MPMHNWLLKTSFLLNDLKNPFLLLLTVVIGTLCLKFLNKLYAFGFFIALCLTFVVTEIIKILYKIPRPTDALAVAEGYRFPSMHAALIATLATSFVWFFFLYSTSKMPRLAVVLLSGTLVIFVCATRVILGVHEVIDVVVGSSIGAVVTNSVFYILYHLSRTQTVQD